MGWAMKLPFGPRLWCYLQLWCLDTASSRYYFSYSTVAFEDGHVNRLEHLWTALPPWNFHLVLRKSGHLVVFVLHAHLNASKFPSSKCHCQHNCQHYTGGRQRQASEGSETDQGNPFFDGGTCDLQFWIVIGKNDPMKVHVWSTLARRLLSKCS